MEMKKETTQVTVSVNKRLGNGRVKFNRVIGNIFRFIFRQDVKHATVDEVSLDGIFTRIEAEKEKIRDIMLSQASAIEERIKISKIDEDNIDKEVAELKKKMKRAIDKKVEKLAGHEVAKAAIVAEKIRGQKIIENMNTFYGITK